MVRLNNELVTGANLLTNVHITGGHIVGLLDGLLGVAGMMT